jgi:hypothetical protein
MPRRLLAAIPREPRATVTKLPTGGVAIELEITPRTKKNSQSIRWRTIRGETRPFIRQSEASQGFAFDVRVALLPLNRVGGFPLPDRPYALSCCFWVDNRNCDTVGLVQALQDALEGAGVVSNDRHFTVIEKASQVYDAVNPRVRCTITPADP